ncbi:MAG: hypothetical protein ACW98D_15595 [Promethearchaeota archaeon]|jgi:hypothetical protein
MSLKVQLTKCIETLLEEYEREEKCGIFFNLEKGKDPLEIMGVIDFLKYKIENWGNSNIFSYLGHLFNDNTVLVIGSTDIGEAKSIIKYVYLSQILKKREEIEKLISKFKNCKTLEHNLENEITNKIKLGYPADKGLEKKIEIHLKTILSSKLSEKSN